MNNQLNPDLHAEIVQASYQIADQAREYFESWRAGQVYIPQAALRAMGRRYLKLRDLANLSVQQLYEFGRLYAFFALLYPPDANIPSPADIAVEFCNLLSTGLPVSAHLHKRGGEPE